METSEILALTREALSLMVIASAPPVLASLLIGLVTGLFQATTSVQDSTIAVVPKLCAAVLSLIITGPWIGQQMSRFATQLFLLLPEIAL